MAGGGALALGRSKAKRYDASATRVSFADVAGIDEVEDELKEIVDFLKNPDRYRKLGAAIPKGVLLSGSPGTACCSRARSPAKPTCRSSRLSASEFVEMVVGVGASRVRDLFEQAKKESAGDHLHRRARRDRPRAAVAAAGSAFQAMTLAPQLLELFRSKRRAKRGSASGVASSAARWKLRITSKLSPRSDKAIFIAAKAAPSVAVPGRNRAYAPALRAASIRFPAASTARSRSSVGTASDA